MKHSTGVGFGGCAVRTMLGETIDPSLVSRELLDEIHQVLRGSTADSSIVRIGITGESGSGKSHLAAALDNYLSSRSEPAVVIQMDDYFHLPPRQTAARRLESLNHVGPSEVDLERLDRTLAEIGAGERKIEKPLVAYHSDQIGSETLELGGVRYVLVEGTYVALLENLDFSLFIERTFEDTRQDRAARNREPQTEELEQILRIEHSIVKALANRADRVVTRDGRLERPQSRS